eukprot:scaffold656_cov271-Chaetoceros_neogracile.AAC.45
MPCIAAGNQQFVIHAELVAGILFVLCRYLCRYYEKIPVTVGIDTFDETWADCYTVQPYFLFNLVVSHQPQSAWEESRASNLLLLRRPPFPRRPRLSSSNVRYHAQSPHELQAIE